MRNWFFDHFEDPAEMTPYDSKEGGYQYLYGGPYDAYEELSSEFGSVYPDEWIKELANRLNSIAPEWSPGPRNLDWATPESEEEPEHDEITHPFDPSKINIIQKPLTVDSLLSRMRHDEINLSPDFQRRSGLWKSGEKSRLIESLLLKIPLPTFFFDATNENQWLVVDGLQRLTTLREFVIEQSLKLQGLEFLTQLNGLTFDKLPRPHQRRIQETDLTVCLIQSGTPEDVKFNIFKRINTGGLPLSYQEIRHALYLGAAAKYLEELSECREFREATCNSIRNDRRQAEELVLRALAFTLNSPTSYPSNRDLDSFLNQSMKILNGLPKPRWNELRSRFTQGLTVARQIFGRDAFRKRYRREEPRKPISKALFEVWVVNLGTLSTDQQIQLIERSDRVQHEFMETMKDPQFERAISTGTGSAAKVRYRFSKIESLIEGVLRA